ncbi:MAG: hypothetical protein SangKO_013930 [Sandaracinaceae bacterium]
MLRALSLLSFALSLSACAEPAGEPDLFIALTRDFEDFESWIVFDRGVDPVLPSHDHRSVIYLDRLPERGRLDFPVGTRIVRTQEPSEDPTGWELHAMVKRGDGFNAEGAAGWEFFELALTSERRPAVVWRGEGPPDGDGYFPGAPGADVLSCNHCHASAVDNDSVLSPALDLAALAPPE